MTVITPDTFDALKRYVGVRLQQGVPLVDADWNELEDARRFELRTFLKWFVGDGVPFGSDGFRIDPAPGADDVVISPGLASGVTPDPLSAVGRCLVNGLDVMIATPINFRDQPLHAGKGAAATQLAAKLGLPGPPLPVIAEMDAVTGPVTIYLDVWERLVSPAEDPALVLPGLGTESCARIKREWVVRARAGSTVPVAGQPDFIPKHSYYALAQITRRGAGVIGAGDIVDRRERRLLTPPATLVEDTLGMPPADYRRGAGRPAISLRTAINALLRGELPMTAEMSLSPSTGIDAMRRAFVFDNSGGIVAAWASTRAGTRAIQGARLELADPEKGYSANTPLTDASINRDDPHLAVLPSGELLLTYTYGASTARDVKYKRAATFDGLSSAQEQDVAVTQNVAERAPTVAVSGDVATFFYQASGTPEKWLYRRLNHTTNAWIDGAGQEVFGGGGTGAVPSAESDLHAVTEANGVVWIAHGSSENVIRTVMFIPGTAARAADTVLSAPSWWAGGGEDNKHPFLLLARVQPAGWLFWDSSVGGSSRVVFSRWLPSGWSAPALLPGGSGLRPVAVEAPDGGIWVIFQRPPAGGGPHDLMCQRLDAHSMTMTGRQVQMTFAPSDDSVPFALAEPAGTIWTFWGSDRAAGGTDTDIYYKRLFVAV